MDNHAYATAVVFSSAERFARIITAVL